MNPLTRAMHSSSSSRVRGKSRPLGVAARWCPDPPHPLQQEAYRARRPDLADEVHGADVDAELQRRGRDAEAYLSFLEPPLRVVPALLGEAPVVRHDVLFPQPLRHQVRDPLHEAPGVHEDQRGTVLPGEAGDAVQHVRPLLVGRNGPYLVAGRQLDGDVHLPGVPRVDHGAAGPSVAANGVRPNEEAGDLVDRPLGGGQPDAGHRPVRQRAQPLHRQAQVRAPLVAHHGVQLVQYQSRSALQALPPALGCEQYVKGLRRRYENVGRALGHGLALRRWCITRPYRCSYLRQRLPPLGRQLPDPLQRHGEVAVDVVGQRLQRRDVDDLRPVAQPAVQPLPHQAVEARQERGKGLAGAGGRRDQRVLPVRDSGPPKRLRIRGLTELTAEPVAHEGMKQGQRFRPRHQPSTAGAKARIISTGFPWRL